MDCLTMESPIAVNQIALPSHNEHDGVKISYRNNFDALLIGSSGKLEHTVDFRPVTLVAPFVAFVHQGQFTLPQIQEVNGIASVWVIQFRPNLLPENPLQLNALLQESVSLEVGDHSLFERMNAIAGLIFNEVNAIQSSMPVVRHLLGALITMVESLHNETTSNVGDLQLSSQRTTFRNLLRLLEENFRRPAGVEFYADSLSMTSRNLNLICQNVANLSVSEIIEERRMLESKKLLASTDKPISEIGYEVGYNEKSCFTSVFKKKHGQTPSAFRKEFQKLIS